MFVSRSLCVYSFTLLLYERYLEQITSEILKIYSFTFPPLSSIAVFALRACPVGPFTQLVRCHRQTEPLAVFALRACPVGPLTQLVRSHRQTEPLAAFALRASPVGTFTELLRCPAKLNVLLSSRFVLVQLELSIGLYAVTSKLNLLLSSRFVLVQLNLSLSLYAHVRCHRQTKPLAVYALRAYPIGPLTRLVRCRRQT